MHVGLTVECSDLRFYCVLMWRWIDGMRRIKIDFQSYFYEQDVNAVCSAAGMREHVQSYLYTSVIGAIVYAITKCEGQWLWVQSRPNRTKGTNRAVLACDRMDHIEQAISFGSVRNQVVAIEIVCTKWLLRRWSDLAISILMCTLIHAPAKAQRIQNAFTHHFASWKTPYMCR